ncbi:MAG TPA: hypothetical protein VFA30_08245 [Gaiellaceae bacterium]|nr:hypothetical protein [Gaiellaceae bacterium]
MRRAAVGIALAAAVAAAGVVLLGHTGSQTPIGAAAQLVARAGFDPPTVQFGDTFTARVVVLSARGGPVRVVDDLAPLTRIGTQHESRTTRGGLEVVTLTSLVACLAQACTTRPGDSSVRLAPVRVEIGGRRAVARWPTLHVHSRVTAADLAASAPPFRGDTTPPPPTYRVAPHTLALLLDLLAALFAVAAVALGGGTIRSVVLRRRRAAVALGDLELALRLTRESGGRPAPDRRRALGLLARRLDRRDPRLAGAANDLAWSRPAPEPDELFSLADEVERSVGE